MSDWTTRMLRGEPRDLKVKGGKPVAVAAWRAPLLPLAPEACANCGAERQYGSGPISGDLDPPILCPGCGLTEVEDRSLHRRYALKHGSEDYVKAAEAASAKGRQVMALKLATAGFHYGQDPVRARLLRTQLLRACGLDRLADEEETTLPVLDLASLLEETDPDGDGPSLLARARTRYDNDDLLAAGADALDALADERVRPQALELLLRIAEGLNDRDPERVVELINGAAPYSHRSADLCFALARAEYARRKLSACRRWLLHTRRLSPTHAKALDLLDVVEDLMNVASTTGPFTV